MKSYDLSHDSITTWIITSHVSSYQSIYRLHKQLNEHFIKIRYLQPLDEFQQRSSGYQKFWKGNGWAENTGGVVTEVSDFPKKLSKV
jgi:hypothetical protein